MNQNLFQRILFTTLLFFSFQATLIFVEMPLYIQLFFLLLSFGYSASFLSLYMMKSSHINELSLNNIFIFFVFLWGSTIIYNFEDANHIMLLEFIVKTLSFISFYKNMEKLLPKKVNFGVTILFYALNHATNHFLLNNFFAFNLSFATIRYLSPKTFKNLIIFMVLSFIYEFYWVYYSDKELYLLNSVNGPIKIVFPMQNGYSFIGIIDLIIPGMVLNFALNYDCFRLGVKNKEQFELLDEKNTIYFNFIFCSFFVGLLTLYSVLTNTHTSQALLCYVLTSCGLGFWFLGYKRNEMKHLLSFEWMD